MNEYKVDEIYNIKNISNEWKRVLTQTPLNYKGFGCLEDQKNNCVTNLGNHSEIKTLGQNSCRKTILEQVKNTKKPQTINPTSIDSRKSYTGRPRQQPPVTQTTDDPVTQTTDDQGIPIDFGLDFDFDSESDTKSKDTSQKIPPKLFTGNSQKLFPDNPPPPTADTTNNKEFIGNFFKILKQINNDKLKNLLKRIDDSNIAKTEINKEVGNLKELEKNSEFLNYKDILKGLYDNNKNKFTQGEYNQPIEEAFATSFYFNYLI